MQLDEKNLAIYKEAKRLPEAEYFIRWGTLVQGDDGSFQRDLALWGKTPLVGIDQDRHPVGSYSQYRVIHTVVKYRDSDDVRSTETDYIAGFRSMLCKLINDAPLKEEGDV